MARLLDLFCGAGGAATGYDRAGFSVTGVDHAPQPRYPFAFVQADALEFVRKHGHKFDAIHASPPCQRFAARGQQRRTHPDLIAETRAALAGHRPYVIENVPAAPLHDPMILCGQMFELGVYRHRAFEVNWRIVEPRHVPHAGHIGDGQHFTVTGHTGGHACKKTGGRKVAGGTVADWRAAMGISWMTADELVEAIPPAYTEFIGRQLLDVLTRRATP